MRTLSRLLHAILLTLAGLLVTSSLVGAQVDVLTHRYDNTRSGANLKETTLKPSNVNKNTFGKLAFRLVDGNVYAQPLIVSQAKIAGRTEATNVAIVATAHNSVYAFDAEDTNQASTAAQLWHTGPGVLGTPIEYREVGQAIGLQNCQDLTTEVGIISTPVMRLTKQSLPKEGVIFIVAKSKSGNEHVYKLFALNLADGTKISEVSIEGEVKGKGFGSTGTGANAKIRFDPRIQLNRPALLLHGNTLYIAFGGHCDRPRGNDPPGANRSYHGWVFAYDVSDPTVLQRLAVFCTTPNGRGSENEGRAGIWMSGHGLAEDSGNIYFVTGDGTYDPANNDYGNSVVKAKLVNGKIEVQDWYAPQNRERLKKDDADLGSVGAVPVPDSHLLLAGGKEGRMYLIDREKMGKGETTSFDSFQVTHDPFPPDRCKDPTANPHECHYYNLHGAPVIWPRSTPSKHMFVYINGEEDPLKQYRLVPDTGTGAPGWKFESPAGPRNRFEPLKPFVSSCRNPGTLDCISAPYPNFPTGMFHPSRTDMVSMPGGFLSLSADGDKDGTGIIWVNMPYASNANKRVVRGVLRAFDASDVSRQLWESEDTGNQNDRLGQFAKYCPPVVANGKVYIAVFQAEMVREADEFHSKLTGGDQPALVIYGLK